VEKKTHSFSETPIKCRTLALKLAKNNIKQNSIASMISLIVCDLRIGLLLRWLAAAAPPLGACCSAMVFFWISDFGFWIEKGRKGRGEASRQNLRETKSHYESPTTGSP
jgi:stalled ribosome alternative rescue factor ArfA